MFDAPGLGESCQPTLRELPPPRPISQLPQVLFRVDLERGYFNRVILEVDVTQADDYTNLIPTDEVSVGQSQTMWKVAL